MESDPVSCAFSESLDEGDSVFELCLVSTCHSLDFILYQQHQTNITFCLASNKQVEINQYPSMMLITETVLENSS